MMPESYNEIDRRTETFSESSADEATETEDVSLENNDDDTE